MNEILVTSADVVTCPYHLVQPITVSSTEDYGLASRNAIFSKLRDHAAKLGADAVVLVVNDGGHISL